MEVIKTEENLEINNLEDCGYLDVKEQEILDVNVSNNFLNLVYGKDEENFKKNIFIIKEIYNKIYNHLKKFLEEQEKYNEILSNLNIKTYSFISNEEKCIEKMSEYYKILDNWLEEKKKEYVAISDFDKNITNILPENAINNLLINQKIKNVNYKLEEITKDRETNNILKNNDIQLNVFKQLINKEFELKKAKIHLYKLQEQCANISKKKLVEKVVDKISGKNKIDNEKKKKINEIIDNVNNKIKYLERNEDLYIDKKIDLEKVIAKIEMFIDEELNDIEATNVVCGDIKYFYRTIINCCDFDEEKVEQMKIELKKIRLPMVIEQGKINFFKLRSNKIERTINEFNSNINQFASENGYYSDMASIQQNELDYEKSYRIISKINKIFDVMKEIDMYISSTDNNK